ncbi:hypothetical protein DFJ73DRAFT_190386 [Zopfochytrium polystomum]|nr:hypothetical protein DFJ73DRAFT_190386 [Zopfochytrium polystomum]
MTDSVKVTCHRPRLQTKSTSQLQMSGVGVDKRSAIHASTSANNDRQARTNAADRGTATSRSPQPERLRCNLHERSISMTVHSLPIPDVPTLRHRLNQLDYTEDFGTDSALLVQRLLADLVRTTESMKKFKHQLGTVQREKAALEEQIKPLRSEIARLTAENNQVHLELVKMADDRDASQRRTEQQARKREAEEAELRFLATQYNQKAENERMKNEFERQRVEENAFEGWFIQC